MQKTECPSVSLHGPSPHRRLRTESFWGKRGQQLAGLVLEVKAPLPCGEGPTKEGLGKVPAESRPGARASPRPVGLSAPSTQPVEGKAGGTAGHVQCVLEGKPEKSSRTWAGHAPRQSPGKGWGGQGPGARSWGQMPGC